MKSELATSEHTANVLAPPLKVVLGCLANDQHESGAMLVASFLRDAGADVVYMGRFNLPPDLIQAAMQEDADVIAISVHSWDYIGYLTEIKEQIELQSVNVSIIIGGTILTAQDETDLLEQGVAAVSRAGATQEEIIETFWQVAAERRLRN